MSRPRPKTIPRSSRSRRPSPDCSVGARCSVGLRRRASLLGTGGLLAACGVEQQRRHGDRHRHLRLQRLGRRAQGGLSPTVFAGVRDRRRRAGDGQHGRPQHLPGAHQQLPAGQARTTSSPGSPATGCGSSPRRAWPATSATSGASRRNFTDSFKKASTGDDGKQYFVPFYNYPWAVFYRKSVFGRRLRGPDDAGRAQDARRPDEEGRPHPDRVRRQGRLAGDGHLRHPQHAHQRLRVPHRPDGRQGVVGGREGQEGLRHLGGAAAAPPGRRARPHLAGGRAQSLQQKKSGMYLLGTFVGQQFDGDDHDDLDFFPFPEIDSEHRHGRASTPRSTAS